MKRWVGALIYRLKPGQAETAPVVGTATFHALKPDDVAMDCGANLGVITEILARNGA